MRLWLIALLSSQSYLEAPFSGPLEVFTPFVFLSFAAWRAAASPATGSALSDFDIGAGGGGGGGAPPPAGGGAGGVGGGGAAGAIGGAEGI